MRMPDTFIPVAEASGLIVPLGAWVLREACREGAAWAAAGLDLRVAVNLSAQQVGHHDIVATIDDALDTTGMRGDRLLVEVTESTVLEHAERITQVLESIRNRGIDIAIDDFGTGYSSLLYLKKYPIQALKIDRQFVSGLGTTSEDDAIVAGVIAFARAVGATCIAEGVETAAQYELLQALRCHFAQGYLFSRPVPARDVPAAMNASRATLASLSGKPTRTRTDSCDLTVRPS
jgi:EAL domain-containing protein (putative c-di-GMP-specific phosphodiesterase class I)